MILTGAFKYSTIDTSSVTSRPSLRRQETYVSLPGCFCLARVILGSHSQSKRRLPALRKAASSNRMALHELTFPNPKLRYDVGACHYSR